MSDTGIFNALENLLSESGITVDREDIQLTMDPRESLSSFLDPEEGWHVEYDPDNDSMTAYSPPLSRLSNLPPTVQVPYAITVKTTYHHPERQKEYGLVLTITPSEKRISLDEPLADDNLYSRVIKLGKTFGFTVEGA